jgi:ATP-dependent Clp protease ATP-binding subunit ClpC
MDLAFLLVGAAVGWLIARVRQVPTAHHPEPPSQARQPDQDAAGGGTASASREAPPAAPPEAAPQAPDAGAQPPDAVHLRLLALTRGLADACEEAEHAGDIADRAEFREAVRLLTSPAYAAQDRLNFATSSNTALSCAALVAMAEAGDDSRRDLARLVNRMGYLALHFALAHLAAGRDPEVAADVLLRARWWWPEHPPSRMALRRWLDAQEAAGVVPHLPVGSGDLAVPESDGEILAAIGHPLAQGFLAHLRSVQRARRGLRELSSIGRDAGTEDEGAPPVCETEGLRRAADAVVDVLARADRPSLVLVGEPGCGKTTLVRVVVRELARRGWRIIEASPSQINAGQRFVGDLEQRIEDLVAGLGSGPALWYVPDCHQRLESGAHSSNPRGLLDLLLPHLERRGVQLLGESTDAAWARVRTERPRVATLLPAVRVEPLDAAATRALALAWCAQWRERLGREVAGPSVIDEATSLARQIFPTGAEPGRTISLLRDALEAARAEDPAALPLRRDQLLATLARRSGIPAEILDVERPLDLDALRTRFLRRVIGQDEAVDCLVDRISMLKAGLTDPGRPIGVFLFAGPTGTGKTELAKTLAEVLFGSPERMLRFDMSEYQGEDSAWRLIDEGAGGRAGALAARIRSTPFAVVLLDEFEKAHPRVWDLFLQVFDDGRLTDRAGNTADFRHSIVLMTSNLGSTIAARSGAGFTAQAGGFSRSSVDRALQDTFRREFVNRIDRVVVFNPLTRALMRDILAKELRDVLERRGFRQRDWAVEWEPSAIEFLLDRGFTPDLGARPLRRAIDQYLLAPLARTMVEHRVPSGEQFLFVHGDRDALAVRFVDPDGGAAEPVAEDAAERGGPGLRAIALDPRGATDVLVALAREIDALDAWMSDDDWTTRNAALAQAMQHPDFWQRDDRRPVLDQLERMDRLGAGLRSARSLHGRLQRSGPRGAVDLVRRLALLILAMRQGCAALEAGEPEDASVRLQLVDDRHAVAAGWRERLVGMYRAWAEARGMRMQRADAADGREVQLSVSGFGAFALLRDETGLHVLDGGDAEGAARATVRVVVEADGVAAVDANRPCRRYTERPAPLVRDAVRGWRTGRLDRVLGGDFDLFAGDGERA